MLQPYTEIEVIAIKDGKAFKKIMTYDEALRIERKNGYSYKFYQKGFSQFKTEETKTNSPNR